MKTTHTRDGQDITLAVDVEAFASAAWRKVLCVKQRPGMLARRHLEVCVFSGREGFWNAIRRQWLFSVVTEFTGPEL